MAPANISIAGNMISETLVSPIVVDNCTGLSERLVNSNVTWSLCSK